MRFIDRRQLSPAMIVSVAALFISLGGVAVAASTLVNITDPFKGYKARVTPNGDLQITTAAPASFFTPVLTTVSSSCVTLVQAPAGRALVIRQIRADVYSNPAPGTGKEFVIYRGPNCVIGHEVAGLIPPNTASFVIPFDPGLALGHSTSLSAIGVGVSGRFYVDGYYVTKADVGP
jgi:hypothetical protein